MLWHFVCSNILPFINVTSLLSLLLLYSWSKTQIFAASTITQYWLDNTIIIIFFLTMEPLFTVFKNWKQSTRLISTKFIHSIWMAAYKISFFPDKCFVRKWRLKFQVSKYCLRWNAENMASSIMSSKKNYTTQSGIFARNLTYINITSLFFVQRSSNKTIPFFVIKV